MAETRHRIENRDPVPTIPDPTNQSGGAGVGSQILQGAQGLELLFGSETTTDQSGTTVTKRSPEIEALLVEIAKAFSESSSKYTPEKAAELGEAAFAKALRETLETYMPQVSKDLAGSGFSTTSGSRMRQENLAIKAAEAGSMAQLNALTAYSNLAKEAAQTAIAAAAQTGTESEQTGTNTAKKEGIIDTLGDKLSKSKDDASQWYIDKLIGKKKKSKASGVEDL